MHETAGEGPGKGEQGCKKEPGELTKREKEGDRKRSVPRITRRAVSEQIGDSLTRSREGEC